MKFLPPVESLSEAYNQLASKRDGESGQPQQLDDDTQQLATLLGRQNSTYSHVWERAEEVAPQWLPIECHSYRRALLLASSAIQHRTKAFDVQRRGRLVCVRFLSSERRTVPREIIQAAAVG